MKNEETYMTEKDLKIIPFPSNLKLLGGTLQAQPFTKNPIGKIGDFLEKEGDCEVVFATDISMKEEEYSLRIDKNGIGISASSYAGFLYGTITLQMIQKQFNAYLPCLFIQDCPVLPHRGAQVSYAQINVKYKAEWLKKQ